MGCTNSRDKTLSLKTIYEKSSSQTYHIREIQAKDFDNGLWEIYKNFFRMSDNLKITREEFKEWYTLTTDNKSNFLYKTLVFVDQTQKDPKLRLAGIGTLIIRYKFGSGPKLVGYIEDIATISPLKHDYIEDALINVMKNICFLYQCQEIHFRPSRKNDNFERYKRYGFSIVNDQPYQDVDKSSLMQNSSMIYKLQGYEQLEFECIINKYKNDLQSSLS